MDFVLTLDSGEEDVVGADCDCDCDCDCPISNQTKSKKNIVGYDYKEAMIETDNDGFNYQELV